MGIGVKVQELGGFPEEGFHPGDLEWGNGDTKKVVVPKEEDVDL